MTDRPLGAPTHLVQWLDHGRTARNPPNPAYPNGIDVVPEPGVQACRVELPYPAVRCGIHLVTCNACGYRVGVTAAGRPDDPRSVAVPCQRGTAQ